MTSSARRRSADIDGDATKRRALEHNAGLDRRTVVHVHLPRVPVHYPAQYVLVQVFRLEMVQHGIRALVRCQHDDVTSVHQYVNTKQSMGWLSCAPQKGECECVALQPNSSRTPNQALCAAVWMKEVAFLSSPLSISLSPSHPLPLPPPMSRRVSWPCSGLWLGVGCIFSALPLLRRQRLQYQ